MPEPQTDKTGAPVRVVLGETRPISAYTVSLDDGTLAGRADFVDPADGERVFFHTEIAPYSNDRKGGPHRRDLPQPGGAPRRWGPAGNRWLQLVTGL